MSLQNWLGQSWDLCKPEWMKSNDSLVKLPRFVRLVYGRFKSFSYGWYLRWRRRYWKMTQRKKIATCNPETPPLSSTLRQRCSTKVPTPRLNNDELVSIPSRAYGIPLGDDSARPDRDALSCQLSLYLPNLWWRFVIIAKWHHWHLPATLWKPKRNLSMT